MVKGTTNGNSTDIEGQATLKNVPANSTVVVSYVGYLTQEVKLAGRRAVTVKLIQDAQALEEVVVVGYGALDKKQVTSAITSIKADDLMKDRVLLDPDTAWLLFGGTELSGMSFSINGVPYVVAGVVEREDDRFSKKAYGDTGMGIYMSYDGYCALLDQSASATTDDTAAAPPTKPGISCYEIVLAEPVKNFAYNAVKDKFPIGSGEIVDNTHRFDTENIWKLAKDVTARSMRGSAVVYPYWENAARGAEDTCALYMLCAIVTGLFPAGLALFVLIRGIVRGKTKLEEDVFPKWKENISEAIRVRERKRWEKEHPGET